MIDEIKSRIGEQARTITLPFEHNNVAAFLQALRERRWVFAQGEAFRVAAAEYDKYYDEVTFVLDLRRP